MVGLAHGAQGPHGLVLDLPTYYNDIVSVVLRAGQGVLDGGSWRTEMLHGTKVTLLYAAQIIRVNRHLKSSVLKFYTSWSIRRCMCYTHISKCIWCK